ncbi:hypothetical protein BO71DRAFT_413742 [Aspergillus ellipticus CBS 707.79]|uniref:Uncharacterized protein n=1 Tax=Aspergillus ellipticus CBS 707.79 TaxID=1448320 RepID=A0A319CWL5_9EURO|nr:hypothetical protein BO71DRAFT_413742 [Aspergillus ellipticus CBS 707.79]
MDGLAVKNAQGSRAEGEQLSNIPGASQGFHRWERGAPNLYATLLRKVLRVDQPSVFDLKAAIKSEEATIREIESGRFKDIAARIKLIEAGSDDAYVTDKEQTRYESTVEQLSLFKDRLDRYRRFLNGRRYYLGEVVAGSGLWRNVMRNTNSEKRQPGVMDWALIEVMEERQGPNEPFPYHDHVGGMNFMEIEDSALRHGTKLLKCGRSSHYTEGEYNGIKQAVVGREYDIHGQLRIKITYEHSVISRSDAPFAKPGDSGSFVFTQAGDVAGMLFGGFRRKDTMYFIHVNDPYSGH